MISSNAQKLGYSLHANIRAKQRGFTPKQVATIIRFGRKNHQAGAIYYSIGHKEIKRYYKQAPFLQDMNGMHIVMSLDGTILTMFRNRNFKKIHNN